MRRFMLFALCALALTPPLATAKGRVDLRSPPPATLEAGQTWHARLTVHATPEELARSGPPSVFIHSDKTGWAEIKAVPNLDAPGAYTADVIFPTTGTWTYHVEDPVQGGGYDFPPVVIKAPGGPSPWLLVAPAVAAIAIAAFVARRRRSARAVG